MEANLLTINSPQLGKNPRFIFISVVLYIILISLVGPLWAKFLQTHPQWLIYGKNNQSLKIIFDGPILDETSKVKIDLGFGVQVSSHKYNSKENTLLI
jgi:hypothetical protein